MYFAFVHLEWVAYNCWFHQDGCHGIRKMFGFQWQSFCSSMESSKALDWPKWGWTGVPCLLWTVSTTTCHLPFFLSFLSVCQYFLLSFHCLETLLLLPFEGCSSTRILHTPKSIIAYACSSMTPSPVDLSYSLTTQLRRILFQPQMLQLGQFPR